MLNETVFTWGAPPLKFGPGALDEIGLEVGARGARSALILTDPGVAETGVPQCALDALKEAGVDAEIFAAVGVEPTDESIMEAVEFARRRDWDAYVAIGGG